MMEDACIFKESFDDCLKDGEKLYSLLGFQTSLTLD
jgi:hypothetical protein